MRLTVEKIIICLLILNLLLNCANGDVPTEFQNIVQTLGSSVLSGLAQLVANGGSSSTSSSQSLSLLTQLSNLFEKTSAGSQFEAATTTVKDSNPLKGLEMDMFNHQPTGIINDYKSSNNAKTHHEWSPYSMNGGSIMAIAGEKFAIIASDTRLSEGYSILSRNRPHIYKLQDKCALACVGFHGDTLTFTRTLETRLKMYEYEHNRSANTKAIGQLVSTMLYYRRFFPYYVNPILAGLDENGNGAIYSYDPVGSYDREVYRASGSSVALLQPLLDSQLGLKNQSEHFELERGVNVKLSKEECIKLVKDAFISAAERDIYCGDALVINVITKDGIQQERFALRED